MPIAIVKSVSSSVDCWNYHGKPVLDVSLTPLPPECNAGHGRGNSVCLYWTGFLGLHYTWVKVGLQGLAISDSKVERQLQGHQQSSWRTPILNSSSIHHPSSLDYRAHHGLLVSSHFYYCGHAKAHHHQCGTQLFAPRFHTLSSFDLEARPKLHRLSLYIYCYVPHYFDFIISGSNLVCLFIKEAK